MNKNEKNQDIEWKGRGFSYFSNTECEFFPCHQIEGTEFNCLFCYCPLYVYKDCGGNCTYLENGVKDCSGCDLPHRRENYKWVVDRLKEKYQQEFGD